MRGRHKLRFRQFRRCVVPLRLALDVKRLRTNDKAKDGNLTAQALAEIVIREQADPCAEFRASRPLAYPPSPRGHAIPDLCLTPKVLGQRPQARARGREFPCRSGRSVSEPTALRAASGGFFCAPVRRAAHPSKSRRVF